MAVVASNPSLDVVLTALDGESRPLEEWLTTFNLACVILDPYTNESSWILKTAARVLNGFRGADVRVNFVVTCDADDAKRFLGPLAEEFLVFTDPSRDFVRSLGLATLPAFVFVSMDGHAAAAAEGWKASEWSKVADTIAKATVWSRPSIPASGDPVAFAGTPALAQ
ncbi:MAG: hypothetical protein JWM34_1236 [Ilumatobacteraceae bacterium]|nr:hypothetical protein [Ilumatobacteraceae bacterium]